MNVQKNLGGKRSEQACIHQAKLLFSFICYDIQTKLTYGCLCVSVWHIKHKCVFSSSSTADFKVCAPNKAFAFQVYGETYSLYIWCLNVRNKWEIAGNMLTVRSSNLSLNLQLSRNVWTKIHKNTTIYFFLWISFHIWKYIFINTIVIIKYKNFV